MNSIKYGYLYFIRDEIPGRWPIFDNKSHVTHIIRHTWVLIHGEVVVLLGNICICVLEFPSYLISKALKFLSLFCTLRTRESIYPTYYKTMWPWHSIVCSYLSQLSESEINFTRIFSGHKLEYLVKFHQIGDTHFHIW